MVSEGRVRSMGSPYPSAPVPIQRPESVIEPTVSASVAPTNYQRDVFRGKVPRWLSGSSKTEAGGTVCRELAEDGCLRASSGRGTALAINHLPPEILFAIFDFATGPPNSRTPNFGRVVSLTHVSRLWKEILLNDGRLWSNVHILGQSLHAVAIQIARCRRAPLSVFIEVPSRCIRKPSRYSHLRANIQGAAQLIQERRGQVKRLEAHMDCQAFPQQLGCEWPSLGEFVWVDTCPLASSLHEHVHVGPVNGVLPRLKDLTIESGICGWPMNIATQLTTFKLKGPVYLKPSALIDFLRRNTSLQSLELHTLDVPILSQDRREEPIELAHLTKLSVRDADCGHILALLNLSSLKRLWVSSYQGRNPWLDCGWSEPCTRLLITTLKARYCTFPDNTYKSITVEGYSGLDTQALRFTEPSPGLLCATMFRALANGSLHSVTSLSLIDNMPEGGASPPTVEICALLGHLPRVVFMRLRPSDLALGVARCLRDDSESCPELRELEVTVTGRTCKSVSELAVEMVKARAGGGAGGKMRKVVYLLPVGSQCSEEVGIRRSWDLKKAELESYLSDE